MTTALPEPYGVANIQSSDGSIIATQVDTSRVVDLSVAGGGGLTHHEVTLGGDVALPFGVTTNLDLTVPTEDGDIWMVTVSLSVLPGATTSAWSGQIQAASGHSTLIGGAQAGGEAVVGLGLLNETTVTWTGVWQTAGGTDTLEVFALASTADATAVHHDDEYGHPCTGVTAIRLASA
jgi:hypothetical protein